MSTPTFADAVAKRVATWAEVGAWIDAHADTIDPDAAAATICSGNGDRVLLFATNPEQFTAYLRCLTDGAAIGGVEKSTDDKWANATRQFGRITVQVFAHREQVCRREQVGVDVQQIPDPDAVAKLPTVEVEVPVYEWTCGPFLTPAGAA